MEQPKVSVIYYGAVGGIQALAEDVAAGAEEAGAVVRVRRVSDHAGPALGVVATPDDVRWADAVVLGSPSRYGSLAGPLRSYVESLELSGAAGSERSSGPASPPTTACCTAGTRPR